ncbi:MAG TPA: TRAM domain-containing protein [candidate division WOR-3 bacterium]|uniref:TRAM domain-containing protein n=1 Tax=candidate division WOR-3 bacterium TaxID=2052148 RepID=A0A7V0T640_UNCW3|nr:TRAM domain-containing protein [candidate division WOR-3 bacterium]
MLFRKPPVFMMDLETAADLRVTRFLEFGLVTGRLLLPEPPAVASDEESGHVADRVRETLTRLKKVKGLQVKTDRRLADHEALLARARKDKATLLTSRPDMKAAANGVSVVSITEVYELFRPTVATGDVIRLRITKRGKEKDEGIGYLEGGVKVVVDGTANSIGQEVEAVVQGSLDTESGRVIFARLRFTELR